MTVKQKVLATVGAVLLTLLIAVVAVSAGVPRGAAAERANERGQATPATPGTVVNHRVDAKCAGDFSAKLAANLGITEDQLKAAIKKTAVQKIDEAEQNGRLTADQATQARDRVNSSDGFPCVGPGDFGGRGGQGMPLPPFGPLGDYADAAATYFDISTDQFRQDLQAAGSLQGVAAKYGKDTADGKAALKSAIERQLRQNLTSRGVAADRVDQIVGEFSQHFDRLYTARIAPHDGRPMPGKGRGHWPGQAPAQAPTGSQ